MVYIPERVFEDKPDTFTPFVPLDPENVVHVCESNLNTSTKKININNKQIALYVFIAIFLYYSLKQYRTSKLK